MNHLDERAYTLQEILSAADIPGLHVVRMKDGTWAARDQNEVWRSHLQPTALEAIRQAIARPIEVTEEALTGLDR